MSEIKTPVRYIEEQWVVRDADGRYLFRETAGDMRSTIDEIVTALNERGSLLAQLAAVTEERDRYRKALEYYADASNWSGSMRGQDGYSFARQALHTPSRRNRMENELKPCPFCGGDALAWTVNRAENQWAGMSYVMCDNCRIRTWYATDRNYSISQWNSRPSPWTPIRTTEDLPKESGEYLVEYKDGKAHDAETFDGTPDVIREWLNWYAAWQRIEPYAPPVNDSDDACKPGSGE